MSCEMKEMDEDSRNYMLVMLKSDLKSWDRPWEWIYNLQKP